MGRSLKKGPYIDETLLARIDELNRSRQKKVLKTGHGARRSRRSSWATRSRSITAGNLSPSTSPRTWWPSPGEFAMTGRSRRTARREGDDVADRKT